ncbi:sulfotransferase family protein [Laspinema olomoucense]|uniref:sulfotransferase family protein n=1 Tax=Laspinema olomoucense TaxID=3231600 RepID=UPI0021BAF867|nr:sulfotransferase [Laspinema sp. D3a]MCT7990849.1 sulfotransferase [Laspinema sp. D3a]
MDQLIKKRIFLVGCPRSGTTLLQSLLAAHPQIASFPESHFFQSLAPAQPWIRALGIGLASRRRARYRIEEFLDNIGQQQMIDQCLPQWAIFMSQYTSAFTKILDRLTQAEGKTLWLEKTPGHLHHIEEIQKFVKEVNFIHIIRQGADNVASLYEVTQNHSQWGGSRNIDQCIDRWIEDAQITQRYLPYPNHTGVRYEKLVENPKSVLLDLCEFLDISFDENMLTQYGKMAKGVVRADESWKASVSDPIHNANGKKFYQLFNDDQRQYILERVSPVEETLSQLL